MFVGLGVALWPLWSEWVIEKYSKSYDSFDAF